jgi:hypothetical protein
MTARVVDLAKHAQKKQSPNGRLPVPDAGCADTQY